MNILTQLLNSLHGQVSVWHIVIIAFVFMLALAWFNERKPEVKSEEYQETNYCNNFIDDGYRTQRSWRVAG